MRVTVVLLAAAATVASLAPRALRAQQPPQAPAPAASPAPADAGERRGELLPMEREELQRRVKERCGVGPETPDSFLPWYYHYVLGMELRRAGDDRHALECLKSAVARRPEPKSGARIYGMWFVDYLPYSAIADVNERLGYRDCAEDARRLADALEPRRR